MMGRFTRKRPERGERAPVKLELPDVLAMLHPPFWRVNA
jgi:hypothetical protein